MPEDKPSFGSELKGAINRELDEAGLSQTRLRQRRAEVAVQLDRAGRGALAFALDLGHRTASGAGRRHSS